MGRGAGHGHPPAGHHMTKKKMGEEKPRGCEEAEPHTRLVRRLSREQASTTASSWRPSLGRQRGPSASPAIPRPGQTWLVHPSTARLHGPPPASTSALQVAPPSNRNWPPKNSRQSFLVPHQGLLPTCLGFYSLSGARLPGEGSPSGGCIMTFVNTFAHKKLKTVS